MYKKKYLKELAEKQKLIGKVNNLYNENETLKNHKEELITECSEKGKTIYQLKKDNEYLKNEHKYELLEIECRLLNKLVALYEKKEIQPITNNHYVNANDNFANGFTTTGTSLTTMGRY